MWIGDVFGRDRGERTDLDQVAGLFEPSSEMEVLERPDNHVVLGSKGSGKSMALKALTYGAWRRRSDPVVVPFVGIYVPMGFDEINLFRVTFDERHGTELFGHFLVATVAHAMCLQGREILPPELLQRVLTPFLAQPSENDATLALAERFLSDRYAVLAAIRRDPSSSLQDVALAMKPQVIFSLRELAHRFNQVATEVGGRFPTQVGLLFDSLDYYGALGATLCPLLQSDSGVPLVVKVAARTLPLMELFSNSNSRPLEPRRDFHVVSLDRASSDDEHARIVQGVICRRVRQLGPASMADMSDEDIVALLFNGSGGDPDDLASFDSLCRLSSGNVLAAMLLLDKAAELQRGAATTKPAGLEPLLRQHRLQAAVDLSRQFWNFEIGVRVPLQKLDARAFCEVALTTAKSKARGVVRSPVFEIGGVAQDRALLRDMLATRVVTARDDAVNKDVQSGFDIPSRLEFDLNKLLLPQYNILPSEGARCVLERPAFDRAFKKASLAARPHLSPRANYGPRDLFGTDFQVFLSVPFDLSKKARSAVLRRSINRLYLEHTGRVGGPGRAFVDVHCLPQVGAFRSEIARFIGDASYLVADISDIGKNSMQAPGVFYEIGLAVGSSKPFALFFNGRAHGRGTSDFSASALPALIRGVAVLVWRDRSAPFHEQFVRVHQRLIAYGGEAERSASVASSAEPPYAYLSFQPRNADAQQWYATLVRRLFPEVQIRHARDWETESLDVVQQLVGGASLRIIDCTNGVNAQALELGIATATGQRTTVMTWSAALDGNVNPVAMFPGARWAWSDLQGDDERSATNLLRDLGRTSALGARRR